MSGYPWQVLIFIPLVLAYVIWTRMRVSKHVAANADKNVGAVAARLGLNVVEGDGNVNLLYFQQPSGDFSRKIRATGQPMVVRFR